MIITMGWRDMFTSRKEKQADALVERAKEATRVQEASFSRLEQTIQSVIDAKTGRGRHGQNRRLDYPHA